MFTCPHEAHTQDALESFSELTPGKPVVAPAHTLHHFGAEKERWNEQLWVESGCPVNTNRAMEAPANAPFAGAGPKDCQVALEGNGTHLKVSLGHHCQNYNQCPPGDGTIETQEGTLGITE